MNLCLFFEGTGRGVAGKVTNVTRLRDICVDDVRQKLHLEAGPGTRLGSYLCGKIAGSDWQAIFRDARRWFEANYETLPKVRKSSTLQPSFSTTPMVNPPISGAPSIAFAAISPESDCTSPVKDFNARRIRRAVLWLEL